MRFCFLRLEFWPTACVAPAALFTAAMPSLAATSEQAKAFSERAAAYVGNF